MTKRAKNYSGVDESATNDADGAIDVDSISVEAFLQNTRAIDNAATAAAPITDAPVLPDRIRLTTPDLLTRRGSLVQAAVLSYLTASRRWATATEIARATGFTYQRVTVSAGNLVMHGALVSRRIGSNAATQRYAYAAPEVIAPPATRIDYSIKLYAAGTIAKSDWRQELLGSYRAASFDAFGNTCNEPQQVDDWPVVETVFPNVSYVGPFFMTCDHGCAHGPGAHGMSAQDYGARHCVDLCLRAIRKADVFFAWLSPGAYGTAVELGYARALHKRIIVAYATTPDDLWFAAATANRALSAPDALTALRRTIEQSWLF